MSDVTVADPNDQFGHSAPSSLSVGLGSLGLQPSKYFPCHPVNVHVGLLNPYSTDVFTGVQIVMKKALRETQTLRARWL